MIQVEVPCGSPPPQVPAIEWPKHLDLDGTYHVSVETTQNLFLLIALSADYFREQRICHAEGSPTSQPAPHDLPASIH